MEFEDHYQNSTEKRSEIIETIGSNYKLNSCVYQSLFSDIAESFFEYIHSPNPNQIQERLRCIIYFLDSKCESFADYFSNVLLSQWYTSFYKWVNYCT